ncbi:MAG TPA: hypothetical protein VJB65_01445 [Patescibacteria group bacterium]|nr:hypothetical protein [Patescibacteria group bacterium]
MSYSIPKIQKKKWYKRWWIWTIAIVFILIIIIVNVARVSFQQAQLAKYQYLKESVETTHRTIRKTISTNGIITPDASTILTAKYPSTVTEVNFSIGDTVNKNDVIIKTENETIVAPFDGRLLALNTFVHELIAPSIAIAEVGYRSNHIEWFASDSEVLELKKDQEVLITVPSFNNGKDEYHGVVSFVDIQKQTTELGATSALTSQKLENGYRVHVTSEDMPEELTRVIGLSVDLEIVVEEKSNVLSLPTGAVQYTNEREAFVYAVPTVDQSFVEEASKVKDVTELLQKKMIHVDFSGDEYTEVTEGLSEGESVLLYVPQQTASPF